MRLDVAAKEQVHERRHASHFPDHLLAKLLARQILDGARGAAADVHLRVAQQRDEFFDGAAHANDGYRRHVRGHVVDHAHCARAHLFAGVREQGENVVQNVYLSDVRAALLLVGQRLQRARRVGGDVFAVGVQEPGEVDDSLSLDCEAHVFLFVARVEQDARGLGRHGRGLCAAEVLGDGLNVLELHVVPVVQLARQHLQHAEQREREVAVVQHALVVKQVHEEAVVVAGFDLQVRALLGVLVESVEGHREVLDLAGVVRERVPVLAEPTMLDEVVELGKGGPRARRRGVCLHRHWAQASSDPPLP